MAWRHTWSFRRWGRLAGNCLLAVTLAALCLLSIAAVAESPRTEGSGIGGTGQWPGEGNGIGGTGGPRSKSARATGIVGTVTGFGSIFVNGFEIDYSPDTQTRSDLDEPLDAKAIRLGQVVEVEAYGEGKHLRARKIAVRYEVRGPIEAVDRASGKIRVLGQTVAAGQSLVAASRPGAGSLNDLAVGDMVDVSGLRQADAAIVASRIEKAATGGRVWLRGRVESADTNGFTLNGVRIDQRAADGAPRPVVGEEAAVLGAYSAGKFRPAKIIRLPKAPFAGRVSYLSIEGFVRDRNGNGFVGGVNIGDAKAAKLRAGDRVVVDGKIGEGGRFIPTGVRPSQFDHAIPRQRGQVNPFHSRIERHDRAPARNAPGVFGARGERWTPHRELHREGTRWQNRASPRRGRKR